MWFMVVYVLPAVHSLGSLLFCFHNERVLQLGIKHTKISLEMPPKS